MPRDLRLHHITRLEYARTRSWWVRIYRLGEARKRGRQLAAQKSFADGVYGSKAKALAAAIHWRDAELPKHPRPVREYGKFRQRPAGTGYIKRGWRTYVHRRTGKRKRYQVWEGWVRLHDGRAAASSYSISRWGDTGAKLLISSWLSLKIREVKNSRRRHTSFASRNAP